MEESKKKPKKEHNLEEYLKGDYTSEDGLTSNEEIQYRSRMRRRVKKDLRFLKLVLEKAQPSDLYMIFSEDEKEWKEVMFPVASRLLTLIGDYLPSEKEEMKKGGWLPASIKVLVGLCETNGLKLSVSRFLGTKIENAEYRKKKLEQLGKKIPELKEKTEFKKWVSKYSQADIKELRPLFSAANQSRLATAET